MSASIRMAGRGLLAAAALASLASLGVTAPARAGEQAVPGFASGIIPAPRAGLSGISCPTASFCVAVGGYLDPLYPFRALANPHGHPLAEEWNGRSWRVMPGGLGGAAEVSCTSARFCMAAGGRSIERWDGRRWTAVRTPPALTDPTGVSCLRASFCMAVGLSNNITGGGQDGCMTGAVWRGTAWHTVTIPFGSCAVPDYDLGPVSCASASDCMAVGTQDGDEHTLLNLALGWNGKRWQVLATPPGGVDSSLSAVSCPSTSFCMALGSNSDGNLALGWDGTTWTKLSPSPSSPAAVWCSSAARCLAVGGNQAMTWNGTAWTGVTISQPAFSGLSDVSCWRPSACMATGAYSRIALPGQTRGQLTLAERWNGSTWQVLRTPSPGDEQEGLSWVSCRSAADCMAVGAFVNGSDVQAALAERWNGSTWKVLATPDPGRRDNVLTAVSCPAARRCIAVGYYDAAGGNQALAERWNGSTWTTLAVPHSGLLTGVSCPAVNNCVAVGTYANGGTSLALSVTWNGRTWTVQASPAPGGSLTEFSGVACPSRARCIAVGDYQSAGGKPLPLTALWNGTAWTTLSTPVPPGGTYTANSLTAVSCSSPRNCMAVGRTFQLHRPLSHALTESWDGTRWKVRPAARLKIRIGVHLNAVSCPAPARCRAVGGYLAPSANGFVLAEAWNGASWRRLVPITDPSTAFNDLYAISCPGVYRCIAVGGTEIQHTLAYQWNGTRWQLLRTPNP